ncbi:hypothetical protein PUNSTDRAFT_131611 [Punctularia strigosozonata HHB-11173 SS5]|uniref:uncharacterized protein n=1 Tax=Punctularia strigosozonata (strain HHB-11173) TaxID=741275 RepID=UPI0004417075|nr:uncharacterized protein PUNSTDRAFT_131611 [Punctularia strigosozonata HHB-11173 SS5]EIN11446.1 hypothetical protein PUNSTDRAFT_131611 [Punctularia strigosozonata HHB-11173 SS5]
MATDIQLMLSITTRTEFLDVRDIHDGGDKLLKTLPAPPTSATAIAIRLVRAVSVQASDCEWRVTLPIRPGDVRSTVRPRDMHVDGPVWEPPVLPCDSSATIRGMETLSTPREDAERAGAGAKRCVQCVHYAATLRLSVPRIALTEKIARDSAPVRGIYPFVITIVPD